MTNSTDQSVLPKRPLSVWILTIFAFIAVGCLPFLNTLAAILTGHFSEQPIAFFIILPVSVGAAVTAVGAWQGRLGASRHLVTFVVIYFLTIAISQLGLLGSGKLVDAKYPAVYIIRGIIFPIIYMYYFNLPSTLKYYECSDSYRRKAH